MPLSASHPYFKVSIFTPSTRKCVVIPLLSYMFRHVTVWRAHTDELEVTHFSTSHLPFCWTQSSCNDPSCPQTHGPLEHWDGRWHCHTCLRFCFFSSSLFLFLFCFLSCTGYPGAHCVGKTALELAAILLPPLWRDRHELP